MSAPEGRAAEATGPAEFPAGLSGVSGLSAREAYREVLTELMAADERVWCLDGDTGLFDANAFGPAKDRYVNLGIAEHNLIGTAAGMAAAGLIPYVNTMAAFAATRALEAVKVDVAYNALPVRIVATHAGLAAGHLGPTHHALEDLAVMRVLPGCTVVVPADAEQAVRAVRATADLPGPVYLRLGRGPTPPLPQTQIGGRIFAADLQVGSHNPSPNLGISGPGEFVVGR
ncbi:MAG: hypothetical protein ACRDUA_17550, partial [Micromonosporaceae bacterium]